jgi:hypothetical protein
VLVKIGYSTVGDEVDVPRENVVMLDVIDGGN